MENDIKESVELLQQYDDYCSDLSILPEDILGYVDWIADVYAKKNGLIRLSQLDKTAN